MGPSGHCDSGFVLPRRDTGGFPMLGLSGVTGAPCDLGTSVV
jgi:hypothetical protein